MSPRLTSDQIEELVSNNLYTYKGNPYIARCFHSDYANSPNLPALSLPGGDIGEIAILIAASLTAGFTINLGKAVNTLYELIEAYDIDQKAQNELVELKKTLGPSGKSKSTYTQSELNACVMIEADYGLFPHYAFNSTEGGMNANILIFQKTFINRRHRKLCKLWVANGSVELFAGLDSDYLYEIISEITENHLFQTLKLSYSNLPLYFASVSPDKKIHIQAY
jgi:hypothetical protein